MPFAISGDARIWHKTHGSGPDVMLVHGGLLEPMDAHRFWVTPGIAAALSQAGYRVTCYDRRFSGGRTVAPIAEHSWDIEVSDLLAVLAAACQGPTHIIAGSNGVSAAIRLASDHPERVRSLALCWPVAPDNRHLNHVFDEARAMVRRLGPAGYVEAAQRSARDRPLLLEHVLKRDSREVESFQRLPPQEAVSILDACEELLLAGDVLRGISDEDLRTVGEAGIPTIVLPADPEDRYHTMAIAETLASGIASASLVQGMPISPSPRFQDHLDDFVARVVTHLASRTRQEHEP